MRSQVNRRVGVADPSSPECIDGFDNAGACQVICIAGEI